LLTRLLELTKTQAEGIYINWLAEPHAQTSAGTAVDVDLSSIVSGFSGVTPVFTVNASCGALPLLADGHTAHFTPASGFHGMSSFGFTVTGSDKSAYSATIAVAVAP
jgi:hypothetical protein